MSAKPAIVFVPGAWHSPDSFAPVTKELEAAGYKSRGVHLPSVGAPVPLENFDPDVEEIQAAIKEFVDQGEDVVLVVHSYGGVIGSQAVQGLEKATREKEGKKGGVSHIVFVSAFVLPENVSLLDALNQKPLPWFNIADDQLTLTPDRPEEIFYNDVKDPSEWVKALKPHSYKTLSTKLTYAGWKYVPGTFLLCLQDNAIPIQVQRGLIDQARSLGTNLDAVEIDASHSPFLSKPKEVASAIRRAAGEKL